MKIRYSDFADLIDIDAFEEAIGWSPEETVGNEDQGYCPWPENHNNGDTTGKFSINREKRVYHCWGGACGGGSLLSLTMEWFNFTMEEATEWLYQFVVGDPRTDDSFVNQFLSTFDNDEKPSHIMPYFNERVLDRFDDNTDWFLHRGISKATQERFSLRFTETAVKRGKKEGDEYVGPAVILPHYWKGRLVGWQSRWLDDLRPKWIPKYTNTYDFPKKETLYGYDQALECHSKIIVVESVSSVLFLHSHGYPAVATFGSSVKPEQLKLLRWFSSGIILAPDNDVTEDSSKWLKSITEYVRDYTVVEHLPLVEGLKGADIGDLAQSKNPQLALDQYIAKAQRPEIFYD